MENKLQKQINQVEQELQELSNKSSELLAEIDKECEKLKAEYGDFIKWENLQKVNMLKQVDSCYIAMFLNDNHEQVEVKITHDLFNSWGNYIAYVMQKETLLKKLADLEKELQKIFDDKINTVIAVDKELKELQVINDNSIYRYSLMGVNNSIPRCVTLLDEQGNEILDDTVTPLKVKQSGHVDIKVGKKCYCLDLSLFDLGNYTSYYDDVFRNLNTPTMFNTTKRKEFLRYILLFSGEKIDTTNKSDEELYKLSREYAKTYFNTSVRKVWDYLNDLLLKRCKDISLKDDGTFKDIINNQVIRISYKKIALILGLKYDRNTDLDVRARIRNTVSFLSNCRLQLIQWKELSTAKKKELETKIKNKELTPNEVQAYMKSGFNIPNTELNSKITVDGMISIFDSIFKTESGKKDGFFRLEFNHLYVNFLIRQNTFKLPPTLFEIDAREKNGYTLGKALSQLIYTSNSKIEQLKNKEITKLSYNGKLPKIETLLQYTSIPNVEQAKALYGDKVNYKRYVIIPFLNALNTLHTICNLEYAFYNSKKGKWYNYSELEKVKELTIKTFLELQLQFSFLPLENNELK